VLATPGALYLQLLLPLPLILAVNWSVARRRSHELAPLAAVAGRLSLLALGVAVSVLALEAVVGLIQASAGARSPFGPATDPHRYAGILLLTTAGAGAMLLEPFRRRLARRLPIDPVNPVHTTALVLATLLLGYQLAVDLSTDVLRQEAAAGASRLAPLDLVLQELPFLAAALLGVGLLTRRTGAEALHRLGLVRPAPWQVLVALAAAGVLFAFTSGVDGLAHRLAPDVARQVDAVNTHIFGGLGNPTGIATIALSAGICEEALFRGALQPRLGLLWTALLFTAVHTQYGLTMDALAVLGAAIGLGLLRRFLNTTCSTVCHVLYNALVGMQGAAAWLLAPAVGLEVVLIGLSCAAWLAERRKRPRVAG
jgi:membrane protease YdiL (CAAX protease family)